MSHQLKHQQRQAEASLPNVEDVSEKVIPDAQLNPTSKAAEVNEKAGQEATAAALPKTDDASESVIQNAQPNPTSKTAEVNDKNPEATAAMLPKTDDASENEFREALEKYKELYSYSTDILLREHDRFNRADDKASKYSTMFVFLIGVVAYFDKWIFNTLKWPDFPVRWPSDLPLLMAAVTGVLALLSSATGFYLANHAIKLRPIVSRPLNQEMLDFFENETRITIYYGLAKENSNAYAENKSATDAKYTILKWTHYLMVLVLALLAEVVVMYCLYSWS